MIVFACTGCGKSLKAREELAGKKVKCPGCGKAVPVPQAVSPVPAGHSQTTSDSGDAHALEAREKLRASERGTPASHDTAAAEPQGLETNPFQSSQASEIAGEVAELTDFLAPAKADGELGWLGGFRILKILGRGGMGVVFEGEDPKLGRRVAIKAMLPHLARSKTSHERFLREARAAAALEHDHIVAIHYVGEDRGAPFIVMPFLKGESLEQRLKREKSLPEAELLRIGRETAEALAAAHKQNLIHRDIKPANTWLDGEKGRVKILDFGLARSLADQSHLTQSGAIIGTPAYMAPEQAAGDPVDHRCDLFSLGCMLYQMATGQLPFRGANTLAILSALASETSPPPPRQVNPALSGPISDLVMQLLAKKPDQRPATAQEVVDALRHLEEAATTTQVTTAPRTKVRPNQTEPGKATPTVRVAVDTVRKRKPLVLVAAGGIAVIAVLAGILIFWRTPNGLVKIESDDPNIEIVFDKTGPIIKGKNTEPISLRVGKHGLLVKRGDLFFETDKLLIKKGETVTLKVELLPGKMQLVMDGKVIGFGEMPLPAPSAPPLAIAPFDAKQAATHQEAWAKHLGMPVEYTNRMGMKFRLIPPGEFTMGISEEEAAACLKIRPHPDMVGIKDSMPAHKVRLSKPYYIGEREVRYTDFVELMKREPGNVPRDPGAQPVDLPLQSKCSWLDCVEFCNRLSEREGLTPAYAIAGKAVKLVEGQTGYRLPTEAQWEYACRAGTTTAWYFMSGIEAEKDPAAAGKRLMAQNQFPNSFGLFNLYTGSEEWCWDGYDPNYYADCARKGVVVDPLGPPSGMQRITRGGSAYADGGSDLNNNSANRRKWPPERVNVYQGFGRLVLPVPEKGQTLVTKPEPTPSNEADPLAAAEWVLSKKGLVTIRLAGKDVVVSRPRVGDGIEQFPKEPFTIVGINLNTRGVGPAEQLSGDDDLRRLANLKDLENLQLILQAKITATGLGHLAGCLNMKELNLAGTVMNQQAAPMIEKFSRLEMFAFPHRGCDPLAEVLGKLPSLRRVGASRCDLTDAGVARLAKAPRLEILILEEFGPLTDRSLKVLAGCRSLRDLQVDENWVKGAYMTLAGLARLQKALPECKVHYEYNKAIPPPPIPNKPPQAKGPVKVFILAGQSNMEGQAVVDLNGKDYNFGKGTLVDLMKDTAKAGLFKHLKDDKGKWRVRDDVWVYYQQEGMIRKAGALELGYTPYGDKHHFGPELQFGHVVGDHFANQVLLIKTCWGGKSLYKDFRPPGSGGQVGPYYTKMIAQVREALANIDTDFPDYQGQGYELAGFVWYHGWNDGVDPNNAVPEYEKNLVNLIKDVRKDLKAPNLPVVIGEITGPWLKAPDAWATLRKAQAAAAAHPEFKGTVLLVETHNFVRAPEDSPHPDQGHHEFGNAETYFLVGDALGKAMLKLLRMPG